MEGWHGGGGGAQGTAPPPTPPTHLAARPSTAARAASLAKQLSLGARASTAASVRHTTSLAKQMSLAARASLATLGWHEPAATQRRSLAARRSIRPRQTTPLLWVILWTSIACEFVSGYGSALTRKWLVSLAGMAEALTHHARGRHTCKMPDASMGGSLHQAYFSAPSAAVLIGTLVGAWLLRSYGRQTALMAANGLTAIAAVAAAAAQNYGTLLPAGLVGEFCGGMMRAAVVVADAELAPARRRLAVVTAVVGVGYCIGAVSASCLVLAQASLSASDRVWFWRVIVAFGAWPSLLLLAIISFMPESPLLLVQHGRTAEALQTLKDLRGPFSDVKAEFSGIITEVAEAHADDTRMRGWADCSSLVPLQLRQLLSWRHRPTLFVSMLLGAALGACAAGDDLSDVLEVDVRGGLRYQHWTLARVIEYTSMLSGGLLVIAVNADRFSRRKVLVAAVAAHAVGLAGMAVVSALPFGGTGADPPYPKPLAAVAFLLAGLISLTYNGVIKPVCLLLPAELSGAGTRSAAVAATYASARFCRILWGLVAHALFVSDRLYLAAALTCVLAVAFTALCWLFVPDGTNGIPLEHCRHAWQRHWYWRRHAERWAIDLPQRRSSSRPSTLRHSLSAALARTKPF